MGLLRVLNEVFTKTGTPVRSRKRSSRWWNSGALLAADRLGAGRPVDVADRGHPVGHLRPDLVDEQHERRVAAVPN